MDPKLIKLFERSARAAEAHATLPVALMEEIADAIPRRESILITHLVSRDRHAAVLNLLSGVLDRKRVWVVTASNLLTSFRASLMKSTLGEENTSNMTKERTERPLRRIVIWSLDVLRDQLAAMGDLALPDFVIMDDAEYLGHQDAGVKFEEILLCLPPFLPVVLLMSDVSNGPELARWLEIARQTPCRLLDLGARRPPVVEAFISSGWDLVPLLDHKSLTLRVKHFLKETPPFPKVHSASFVRPLASILREEGLIPALILMPSAADCDTAAAACEPVFKEIGDVLTQPRVAASMDQHPALKDHPLLFPSLMSRAAPLHRGHDPLWSEWVERFSQLGYLDFVFATADTAETMTIGCHAAVFCTSWRSTGGNELVPLSLWEMRRIVGRLARTAGDRAPFVAVAHAPGIDVVHLKNLLLAPPRHVSSALRRGFPIMLSLFSQPGAPTSLLERSLAAVQVGDEGECARVEELAAAVHDVLPEARCVRNIETVLSLINIRHRLTIRRNEAGVLRGGNSRWGKNARMEEEREPITLVLGLLPCEQCDHLKACHKRGGKRLRTLLDEYTEMHEKAMRCMAGLMIDFERHAQCLLAFRLVSPDQHLTEMGLLAHRTGLNIPQTFVEVLQHGHLLSSEIDCSLAVMGGFVEWSELDSLPRIGPLADEIDELSPHYVAMEPVLNSTTENMLRFGMLAPMPSIEQSAILLALRRGKSAWVLAQQLGITVGALTRLDQKAWYFMDRVRA